MVEGSRAALAGVGRGRGHVTRDGLGRGAAPKLGGQAARDLRSHAAPPERVCAPLETPRRSSTSRGPDAREPVRPLTSLARALGRRRRAILELVLTVVVALGLALAVQAWAVKPYKIPSASMEPTLAEGQRILVDRLFFSPHVGQIIVFHPPVGAAAEQCGHSHPQSAPCDWPNPAESNETYVKRIVAGPGDVISIHDGHVIRNGRPEADSYTRPCAPGELECTFTTSIRVPRGMWFVMGDNRGLSDDSRFWGPIPTEWIVGNAFFTYWPPDKVGTL